VTAAMMICIKLNGNKQSAVTELSEVKMIKTLTILLLALTCSTSAVEWVQNNVKVTLLDNAEPYAKPGGDKVEMESKNSLVLETNQYSHGKRKPGDRAVAFASGTEAFLAKRDIHLSIEYPPDLISDPMEPEVTYIQVMVTQDKNTLGKATIVEGGIGNYTLHMIVDALQTQYFRYEYIIYGVN